MQDEWVADYNDNLRADDYDPAVVWIPQRVVNYREQAHAWTVWKYAEAYGDLFHSGDFTDWSKKRSDSHPFGALDGVHIVMSSDGDPEDRWYEKASEPVDLTKVIQRFEGDGE